MLSKVSFVVAAVYAVTGYAQTPVYTTTLRTTTSSCPVICYDYVNACGQGYGGCVPRCPGDPMPTFIAPSCSKTTTGPITTTSFVPTTTKSTTSTTSCPTLCIDYINTCGGMWGTCVPRCPGSTLPTFTPPPCKSPTTPAITTTPPPTTTPRLTTTSTTSCPTLCVDQLNSCGSWWGTCIPRCPGQTMTAVTPPPCTGTRTTIVNPLPTLRPWEQCGGTTWTGRGVCSDGYVCSVFNEWYSQCVPA
ncbi:hypothetical protein TWF569_002947 [Orbilia oligospora]|uniref:CBM1 domain-containing protein n=1 Tax=Orbilia oligospora TaxID=2813651 RepID=A0A7C8NJP7_ORBOL|nr:hypothetical protein TWF706_007424 [Orbilia oligospora]KAF3111459.1 hypothetical protein TWF102_007123 [Orbilia oligospora]KAF3117285.1 hypothetical protein TWF103_007427 [Orbilia oligospora]KAF3140777.1 hypothetical protein TWF594_006276 [Orbilia oligospora]KAF3152642.1 hypothetical protein TWF569_002947 [Orbilia oligospora]